jgi:hypothetical protein
LDTSKKRRKKLVSVDFAVLGHTHLGSEQIAQIRNQTYQTEQQVALIAGPKWGPTPIESIPSAQRIVLAENERKNNAKMTQKIRQAMHAQRKHKKYGLRSVHAEPRLQYNGVQAQNRPLGSTRPRLQQKNHGI